MNEYEKMSQQAVEAQKNRAMRRPDDSNNEQQENKDFTFVGVMGIILIILGVIGTIGILFSFDWSTYNDIKGSSILYEDELIIMKAELNTIWIMAGASLIGCLALGSILLALDKIIQLLKKSIKN